jgi:hypothetical protein
MLTNPKGMVAGVKFARHKYKNVNPSNPVEVRNTRINMCEKIMEFDNEVDLNLESIPREIQLELLACILRAEKDIERCRSHKFKVFKLRFKEMRGALEAAVAKPLVVSNLGGIGDCCRWKGSINLDVEQGAEATYYAMAAVHSKAGAGGRLALTALQKLDWAYTNVDERFEDLKPGTLDTDQKILFSVILGHMATVERVVRLFHKEIVSYIGEKNVKEEIEQPIANLNKRSLFLNGIMNPVLDSDVESYLANSPKYSKPMKVVASRDGNGSNVEHYTVHSPFLKMDTDDQWAVKEFMPDYEEFLLDEDGKLMEQNLREVSVREVRLGKKTAKMAVVNEPVFRMVKE